MPHRSTQGQPRAIGTVQPRWQWLLMAALLATIPAFYLELLDAEARWGAGAVYLLAALILLAARWHQWHLHADQGGHKLRTDPILKFLIVALSFYMIATFEGPMMSIKTVNSLSHYTDWTVGHVHAGALGWVAMISIGSIYSMLPRLLGREQMHSVKLVDAHFWVHTLGVVFYIASMWIAGVMQGLMWRATNDDGTLTYTFVEALNATYPYYLGRLFGGLLVLAGMLVMAWNVLRTYQQAGAIVPQPLLPPDASEARA